MSTDAIAIALGSNLPGLHMTSREVLESALARFPALGVTVVARSAWWRSPAWPDGAHPDYLNGVALVDTPLGPRSLHAALMGLEASFGLRSSARNAPRVLDLDLIAYRRVVLAAPGLILPHARAAERLFVMGPLAQIAPDWLHPTLGETARTLAREASVGRDARPLAVPGESEVAK